MQLSIENLIDLRVITENALRDLKYHYKAPSPEARRERDRKVASLQKAYEEITQEIKDLTFERDALPFGDTNPTHRCDECRKVVRPVSKTLNAETVIDVCPICDGHYLTKI